MATDPYVPPTRDARPRDRTELPPARAWRADRPGDLGPHQPGGGLFGNQGPDQGYALKLARLFIDKVVLAPGETWRDVEHGATQLALRRASVFGRAPIKDDVEVALLAWGFLPEGIPADVIESLVARRKPLFADAVHEPVHQRLIAGAVPEDVLRLTPAEVRSRLAAGDTVVELAGTH